MQCHVCSVQWALSSEHCSQLICSSWESSSTIQKLVNSQLLCLIFTNYGKKGTLKNILHIGVTEYIDKYTLKKTLSPATCFALPTFWVMILNRLLCHEIWERVSSNFFNILTPQSVMMHYDPGKINISIYNEYIYISHYHISHMFNLLRSWLYKMVKKITQILSLGLENIYPLKFCTCYFINKTTFKCRKKNI